MTAVKGLKAEVPTPPLRAGARAASRPAMLRDATPALIENDLGFGFMAWATPQYSRKKVDAAGKTYIDLQAAPEDRELALAVINNWRTSHNFPLNTLQLNLRKVANRHDSDPTVAQRIKRMPSIRHKLERMPHLPLSIMQDIGGCRAVLSSVDAVDKMAKYYRDRSKVKHKLIREDPYVWEPKKSGYRGIHLVYAYYSDRKPTYNGLRIELQLRSQLQHAWATAVETAGTFTQQALKSSQGAASWLRFFALMSSWLALREGTPLVPGTPTDMGKLMDEIKQFADRLGVVARLSGWGAALRAIEEREGVPGRMHLLELDVTSETEISLRIRTYESPAVAAEEYSALERATEGDPTKDIVLVSVESVASLRRAYPNYFLDTTVFLEAVQDAVS